MSESPNKINIMSEIVTMSPSKSSLFSDGNERWKVEDQECCCCLYEFDLVTHFPLLSTSCSHSLCIHCVEKIWKRNSCQYLCPLCRQQTTCPETINYSLLASFHQYLPFPEREQIDSEQSVLPMVFSFQEIEKAISFTGKLKDRFFCTSTSITTLRNLETVITTFSDCLKEEEYLISLAKEHILLMSQLKHKNIERYLGFASEEGITQAIVAERYPESLAEKLFGPHQASPLLPAQRLQIAIGISQALSYLHNFHSQSIFRTLAPNFPPHAKFQPRPIVHGSLTVENIQLSQTTGTTTSTATATTHSNGEVEYIAKLCNISMMSIVRRYLSAHSSSNSLAALSFSGYAAPESRFGQYDHKSDIYSFGVILIELLTSRPANSIMEYIERGLSLSPSSAAGFLTRFKERYLDSSLEWDERLWQGLFNIAKLCLQKSKDERLDALTVVESLTNLVNQLNTPVEVKSSKKTNGTRSNARSTPPHTPNTDTSISSRKQGMASSSSLNRSRTVPSTPVPSSRKSESNSVSTSSRRRTHQSSL